MRLAIPRRALLAIAAAALMVLALALPAAADLSLVPGNTAQIAWTDGDGVNVRAMPGFTGAIVTTLPEGMRLTIADGPVTLDDGTSWYAVQLELDGQPVAGWVIADYLAGDAVDGGAGTAAGFAAQVSGTDGYGLRVREAASVDGATLTVMPEGTVVDVLASGIWDASGSEWWQVAFDGVSGYSAASYLVALDAAPAADEPAEEAPAEDTPAEAPAADDSADAPPAAALVAGDSAAVSGSGGGLNLRYEPSSNAGVLAVIPEGGVVAVLDGPVWDGASVGWYQVDFAGTIGWAHGGYLIWTGETTATEPVVEQPAATPVESPVTTPPATDTPAETPAAPLTGVGDAIVSTALNYVGTPYVWGGTDPSGFDCSGFTWYVVNNVANVGLARTLEVQVTSGTHVAADYLAPGDLVFFQNTYKWGLSHVGIYIGGGQFVHAGSERTGVVVSNLWDDYWGPRFYTARRVA